MAINLPDTEFVASGARPVADRSAERALQVAAPFAEQAMVGIRENQLESDLTDLTISIDSANNERIAQFAEQEAALMEQMSAIDDQNMTDAESAQLFQLNEQLRRLRSAADQGILGDDELQARTNSLVRQYTRRTPAFGFAFRQTAADFLGRAGPTVDPRTQELIQTAQNARAVEAQIQKDLADRGLPDTLRSRYMLQSAYQTKFQNDRLSELARARGFNTYETTGRTWMSSMNLEATDVLSLIPETPLDAAGYQDFLTKYTKLKNKWRAGLTQALQDVTDPELRANLTQAYQRVIDMFEDQNGVLSAADLSVMRGREAKIIQDSLSSVEGENSLWMWENAPDLMRVLSVGGDAPFRGMLDMIQARGLVSDPQTSASLGTAGPTLLRDINTVLQATVGVIDGTDTSSPEAAEVGDNLLEHMVRGRSSPRTEQETTAVGNSAAAAAERGNPYTVKSLALANPRIRQAISPQTYRKIEANSFAEILPQFTQLGQQLSARGISDLRLVTDPRTKSIALVDGENRLLARSTGTLQTGRRWSVAGPAPAENAEDFFSQFEPYQERRTSLAGSTLVPRTFLDSEPMNILMYMLAAQDNFSEASQFSSRDEVLARLLGELESD